MGKHALLLILLSLVAIGCAKRDELYTVKPDVTLRLGAPDPCSYCKLARYYSDNGKVSVDRPGFRRHLVAIIHGNKRGVYEQQQAVHG